MSDPNIVTPVLACDLSVFTPEERDRHVALSQALFAKAEAVRDLPDGFALRLPADSATIRQIADFIGDDRLCCGFINFGLEVEPYGGPVWLRLTGAEGVKAAIAADFAALLGDDVAFESGLPQREG